MTVRYLLPSEKELSDELSERYPFEVWAREPGACTTQRVGGTTGFGAVTCTRLRGHTGPHVAHVKADNEHRGTRHGYDHLQIAAYWMQAD